jgi:hypothetical protein
MWLSWAINFTQSMVCVVLKKKTTQFGKRMSYQNLAVHTLYTWLNPTISSYEYFPQVQYTVYRTDRPPNKQGLSHGGVLITVTNEFLSNEAKELKTNCEMVWAELTISNARKCQICAYYRPLPDDDISLEPLSHCHSYKYTTMTQTLFVWWSIGPVNSILILWEVFI